MRREPPVLRKRTLSPSAFEEFCSIAQRIQRADEAQGQKSVGWALYYLKPESASERGKKGRRGNKKSSLGIKRLSDPPGGFGLKKSGGSKMITQDAARSIDFVVGWQLAEQDRNPYPVNRPQGGVLDDDKFGNIGKPSENDPILPSRQPVNIPAGFPRPRKKP